MDKIVMGMSNILLIGGGFLWAKTLYTMAFPQKKYEQHSADWWRLPLGQDSLYNGLP